MKNKQLFKFSFNGLTLVCIFLAKDYQCNPYRLYQIETKISKYGYPVKSRKQIAKYADMTSVMYHVYALTYGHEKGEPIPVKRW